MPLLSGGKVHVGAPFSCDDRKEMMRDASALRDPSLQFFRLRRGQILIAHPELPDTEEDDLSLWLGLHNILLLDHPDTHRVWARDSSWVRVELETRRLLSFAAPTDMAEAFARHCSVGAFIELRRTDHWVVDGDLERRYQGQTPRSSGIGRAGLFGRSPQTRSEVVRWLDQVHEPPVSRLLEDALWSSPLTSLLHPEFSPAAWSPLFATELLRKRGLARAVVYRWAGAGDWLQVGAVVAGSLLRSLDLLTVVFGASNSKDGVREDPPQGSDVRALSGEPFSTAPQDVAAVIGALIHLHWLKVLEFDARIAPGAAASDRAVQAFLALPLLLPQIESVVGSPWSGGGHKSTSFRRWEEYVAHVRNLLPRDTVDKLLAALTARIVETTN